MSIGLAALSFGALMIGRYWMTAAETLRALFAQGDAQAQIVVWNIRLLWSARRSSTARR